MHSLCLLQLCKCDWSAWCEKLSRHRVIFQVVANPRLFCQAKMQQCLAMLMLEASSSPAAPQQPLSRALAKPLTAAVPNCCTPAAQIRSADTVCSAGVRHNCGFRIQQVRRYFTLRRCLTTTGSDTTMNALGPKASLYTPPLSRNLQQSRSYGVEHKSLLSHM